VSASGKEISVEKKVAAKNDAITKKGKVGVPCISLSSTYTCLQAVHKELELELGLKQIQVSITTEEERWALR
jgi:exonuclease V